MWFEIVTMSFESLLAKKTRSVLSMLGIIIGVSTVIAVFAIGQGAQNAVNAQFQNLSANSIMVMSNMGRQATASSKLTAADAVAIREQADHVKSVTGAIMGNGSVSFGSTAKSYSLIGADSEYMSISNLTVVNGAFFTAQDVANKEMVAVLGATAAADLFESGTDPVGQTITAGGKKVKVVGVLKEVGSRLGPMSVDEAVILPYTSAEKSILGGRSMVMLNIQADSVDVIETATAEVKAILRAEHKLKLIQEDDFRVMDAGSMVATAQDTAKMMTYLLTAIAAITLLVSGIGIMNVMFVTVAERTKEIGIAKAIGGKRADILGQFLMESVILSMIGGGIGIAIGLGLIPLVGKLNIITLAYSWTGPAIGFGFSVLVGVFFGFYPAFKASRLDPVDALRSE
jgi:putative ABC transport system permease protein